MPVQPPIDWTTVENALYTWFNTANGLTTRWGNTNEPRPSFPYATLNVIAGPTKVFGLDERRFTLDQTRFNSAKITPIANNNATYTVTINGTPFAYVSDSDATVAEITAGLAALIDAGAEPVSATDNGTDLVVDSDDNFVPFLLALSDSIDGQQMSAVPNDGGAEFEVDITGYRNFTLSCQVHTRPPDSDNPTAHARYLMSLAEASLGLTSIRNALNDAGVAVVTEGPIQDVSIPVDDLIETRAVMDVVFRTVSSIKEYVGFADNFGMTGTFEGSKDSPIVADFDVP